MGFSNPKVCLLLGCSDWCLLFFGTVFRSFKGLLSPSTVFAWESICAAFSATSREISIIPEMRPMSENIARAKVISVEIHRPQAYAVQSFLMCSYEEPSLDLSYPFPLRDFHFLRERLSFGLILQCQER